MNTRTPNIYAVYTDIQGCADYRFDAYEEMDFWDDFLTRHFDGNPLPRDWKLPKHIVGNPALPLNDFVDGYTEAPFVSERAQKALKPVLKNEVEFRSIGQIL